MISGPEWSRTAVASKWFGTRRSVEPLRSRGFVPAEETLDYAEAVIGGRFNCCWIIIDRGGERSSSLCSQSLLRSEAPAIAGILQITLTTGILIGENIGRRLGQTKGVIRTAARPPPQTYRVGEELGEQSTYRALRSG